MSELVSAFVYLILAVFLGFIFALFLGITMDVITDTSDEHFDISNANYEGTMIATKRMVNTGYWVPYALAASGIVFVAVTMVHQLLYTRRDEYEDY